MASAASAFAVPAPLERVQCRDDAVLEQVLAGLAESPKRIDPIWFYDERGAALFDRLCALPEYYLTRAELSLMDAHASDIAAYIGADAAVIEFGSGANVKTRVLLEELASPLAYVPVDVARTPLVAAARALAARFPDVAVLPVCTDFRQPFAVPEEITDVRRRVVYFAGSTLGNFPEHEAIELLRLMSELAGREGALLVSIDLVKEPAVLERAHNDAAGVTAEFNRNALLHLNRRLHADFDVRRFVHRAVWVDADQRIEMRLRSACQQMVNLSGHAIEFAPDEELLTEYCHKYTPERFAAMAGTAGLSVREGWTEETWRFSMQLLEPGDESGSELNSDSARSGHRIAF